MKNHKNHKNKDEKKIENQPLFTKKDIEALINDIDSEYFSFEFVPAITKTQQNSISSLMKVVAEKIQEVFTSYRKKSISFEVSEVDSMTLENFLKTLSDDSILFTFDFDGIQCELGITVEIYKILTGIQNINRRKMTSVDSKLCFDFVVKPILSELLKKFNSKSTNQINFRTPKVIEQSDVLFLQKKCVYIEFFLRTEEKKYPISLVFPMNAFEKLVRLGVFSNPRRPLQNPFKYNASVALDRIYLEPNLNLEVGSVIETTKKIDDFVEILKDGQKIGEGELVAVREMFGVRVKKSM